MQVFLLDISVVSEETVRALAETLPAWRREQADRCRNASARRQCILAFCLVRYAIRTADPAADTENWIIGEHGKPCLAAKTPFFSLSHTAHGVAVAVSTEGEVGIDTEAILPRRESLLRRVCSDSEIEEISASEDPSSAFIRLWSAKEAVLKQSGIGIARLSEMRHIPLNGVKNTQISFGNTSHWLSVTPAEALPALQWVPLVQLT
ncbi:MAG: 4'-phosphopantetheinyl transferase superfamily protein [Clostridia bacterium]|nr:4'-phosphopantetheinyl transferase superfamily protein [Clostridia bacterium]